MDNLCYCLAEGVLSFLQTLQAFKSLNLLCFASLNRNVLPLLDFATLLAESLRSFLGKSEKRKRRKIEGDSVRRVRLCRQFEFPFLGFAGIYVFQAVVPQFCSAASRCFYVVSGKPMYLFISGWPIVLLCLLPFKLLAGYRSFDAFIALFVSVWFCLFPLAIISGLFPSHSHKLLAVLFGVDSLFYYPPIYSVLLVWVF